MAGRGAIEHESLRHNDARRVRTWAYQSADAFWERAYGSFLISGGSSERRAYVLSEKLCREMENRYLPSIVLTTSEELEQEMIARMRNGVSGCLHVTSPRYPNYHFFCRWNSEEIFRFFSRAANALEIDDADLSLYLSAFLDILQRCGETDLSALSDLAGYSDADIARIGQNSGASSATLNRILQYAKGGESFRLLLQQVRGVLSPLTTERCATGYNLSAWALEPDAAYIVNLRSSNPQILYAYFIIELQRLLARTLGARLVLSELPISRVGELRDVFLDYLSMARETGLSVSNMSGTLDEEDLKRFKVMLLLLDENFMDSNVEEAVRLMGIYDQAVPMVGGGRASPFSIFTSENYQNLLRQNQLRVRPEDLEGCEAALCGANGREIALVRHLL